MSEIRHAEIPARFLPSFEPRRERLGLSIGLLAATLVTTTLYGIVHYQGFLADFQQVPAMTWWATLFGGFYYSLTVLAILGTHEMGHYLACRHYGVSASYPYFIPVPPQPLLPVMTGTLGAFIKIREPIHSKRALFDIGIAGPLAGFAVAVPALVLGVAWSHVVPIPRNFSGLELGESLLFRAVSWFFWGHIRDGYSLNLHPVGLAAWFGLLATTFNLFPIGQLDGGHISYAVFGRRATRVTYAALATTILLVFVSMSWASWAVLMVVMMFMFGPHHPQTIDEKVPLDRGRQVLAAVALLIFVLSFMPAPMELILPHK